MVDKNDNEYQKSLINHLEKIAWDAIDFTVWDRKDWEFLLSEAFFAGSVFATTKHIERKFSLPESIQQAFNSGDGTYRP